MIGNLIKGRGARGLMNYLTGTHDHNGEERERVAIIGGTFTGSPDEIVAQFGQLHDLRPRLGTHVVHNSLNPPEDEREISDEEWNDIATEWAQRMGFEGYVVVRHDDHVHIAASRIKLDGSVVSDSKDFTRSEDIIRDLERKHGLQQLESSHLLEPEKALTHRKALTHEQIATAEKGRPNPSQHVANIIDAQLINGEVTSVTDFVDTLEKTGIRVLPNLASTGRLNGFAYEFDGVKVTSKALGRGYTLSNLTARGLEYLPERDLERLQNIRFAPDQAVTLPIPTTTPEANRRFALTQGDDDHAQKLSKLSDLPRLRELPVLSDRRPSGGGLVDLLRRDEDDRARAVRRPRNGVQPTHSRDRGRGSVTAEIWKSAYGTDLADPLKSALKYVDRDLGLVQLRDGSMVIDHGNRISVTRSTSASIAVMVAEAKAKGWTSIQLTGDRAFKEAAARAATQAGLAVSNTELARVVRIEKERMELNGKNRQGGSSARPEQGSDAGSNPELRRPAAPAENDRGGRSEADRAAEQHDARDRRGTGEGPDAGREVHGRTEQPDLARPEGNPRRDLAAGSRHEGDNRPDREGGRGTGKDGIDRHSPAGAEHPEPRSGGRAAADQPAPTQPDSRRSGTGADRDGRVDDVPAPHGRRGPMVTQLMGLAGGIPKGDIGRQRMRQQLAAFGSDRYEVQPIAPKGVDLRRHGVRTFTPEQMEKSLGWLRQQNTLGYDIYIRPAPPSETEAHPLVFVDDIDKATADRIAADGYEWIHLNESSPGNFHGWIRIADEPLEREVVSRAGRMIAEQYGADPNSADWRHYGRLAGTANKKPNRQREDGKPIWVEPKAHGLAVASRGPELVAQARQSLEQEAKAATEARAARTRAFQFGGNVRDLAQAADRFKEARDRAPGNDQSGKDFAGAMSLLRRGYTPQQVAQAIAEASPDLAKRHANVEDYIKRTVEKAEQRIAQTQQTQHRGPR